MINATSLQLPNGEIVQVAGANSRKICDLCVSEKLLAGFYGYHGTSTYNLRSHLDFQESAYSSKAAFAKSFCLHVSSWCE
jgi:hypothetical protein